jgi:hypothetical protein
MRHGIAYMKKEESVVRRASSANAWRSSCIAEPRSWGYELKKIEPPLKTLVMPDGEVLTVNPDGEIVKA